MSDLNSPDNINNNDTNTIEDTRKGPNVDNKNKPNTFVEVLLGLGITALVYGIISLITFGTYSPFGRFGAFPSQTIIALADLFVLAGAIIICVKLYRATYKVAAILTLILLAPLILGLLLLGSCILFN